MASGKFDFQALRSIPILFVAKELGFEVRGSKTMCFAGHDDKTPSLSFWVQNNTWRCFGCDRKGSTIDLVKESLEFSTVIEAAEWLSARFSVGKVSYQSGHVRSRSQSGSRTRLATNPDQARREPGSVDPELYSWLLKQCPLRESGYHYLSKVRGFADSTIEKFRIGEMVDPSLVEQSLRKKWQTTRLRRCGILVDRKRNYAKSNRDFLVWFNHCLLFPFFVGEEIQYVQARRISGSGAKYIGLSNIKKPLFNINELNQAPLKSDVYICEGVTDTIAAFQLGWRAVGVLGATSFQEEWVSLFDRVNPVIVPDSDSAGVRFKSDIEKAFRRAGIVANTISIDHFNDLSEAIQSHSDAHKN